MIQVPGIRHSRSKQPMAIHPSSMLKKQTECCIYHEVALTVKNYMRYVTSIKKEWLTEIAPKYHNSS